MYQQKLLFFNIFLKQFSNIHDLNRNLNDLFSKVAFGLTRLGLEPMIYYTQGKQANHYTTDAVYFNWY
jgi:hypothetical protein